ncbi:tyrosine-type recombinase/integrase [Flavobacterium psychrotrophum]|uniref:tyrosine-type recombinase/integrase n=1 Tax=Flavobacterium psychrotrophum TaxID=2294119 RepID=UPI000E311464|nr:phage integrase SAM-like domain-containing protein [Flavobacterium psychrotrophum]
MATVNYLYRSTKESANLILRLLYRHDNKDHVIGANTKCEVSKEYWNKYHNQKRIKDIDLFDKQAEIKSELKEVEKHVLKAFNATQTIDVNKKWLQTQIDNYYNPPAAPVSLPTELVKYMDIYIEYKRGELTETTIRKCNVIKQMVTRYQTDRDKALLISDVDTHFKKDYEDYCANNGYAPSTVARSVRFIKTVCRHAKFNGLETNHQLDGIKTKQYKTEIIYLTKAELETISETTGLTKSLENARDWLLISCYTGQRVSDFMRFTKDWIRYETNRQGEKKPLIEFTQVKTGKKMTIPLSKLVIDILQKRNGEFPRALSDQKYNAYIKEVCKAAGLNHEVYGSKKVETSPGSKLYRKDTGLFEKWELVSSHIGRRTFATNNYGIIPTSFLIYVTGHSTESMFLAYIGKSNKDIAMELTNYF